MQTYLCHKIIQESNTVCHHYIFVYLEMSVLYV